MGQHHILVVEDEPDGQPVIGEILKYLKFSWDSTPTAKEAFQLLEKNAYGALILDIALPGMDGLELLREVRNSDLRELPVIVMTAYHNSQVKQEAINAGCDSY